MKLFADRNRREQFKLCDSVFKGDRNERNNRLSKRNMGFATSKKHSFNDCNGIHYSFSGKSKA